MTIYLLDNDPKKTAEYLDDKSLDKMTKDIAQVLCNVHYGIENTQLYQDMSIDYQEDYQIPLELNLSGTLSKWSQWARACKANYLYLVKLGMACCNEYMFRFNCSCAYDENAEGDHEEHDPIEIKVHKMEKIIEFARDNVPQELMDCECKQ